MKANMINRIILIFMLIFSSQAFSSVTVVVNGSNHTIPQTNERGWGNAVTAWIQAITSYTLQPTGGTFTLAADVDFGASYGLKAPYYLTRVTAPSTAGLLRMAKTDSIGWRNNANGANLLLAVDGSDNLSFGGIAIANVSGSQTLTNKTIDVSSNTISNIANSNIISSAAISLSKLATVTASRLLVSDVSGAVSASTITSTEIGYISGATSNFQDQINARVISGSTTPASSITGTLAASKGGTGLSAYGSSGKLLGMDQAGSVLEYKSIVAGSGIAITSGAGSLTIATDGIAAIYTKGQSESPHVATADFQVPFNQITTTATDTRLIETGNFNLLNNPGFEHTTYSTGWTASAGASAVGTSTDIGTGTKSYTWDASATGQYLTSDAATIPAGMYSNNGEASCSFKTAATDYLLQAYDGSTVIAYQTITPSTTYSRQALNFPIPASGTVALRLASQSNASVIDVDDCYLGRATNLSNVAQASLVGSAYFAPTASCTWSRTNTALGAFSSTAACPAITIEQNSGPGTIATADTDLPQIVVSNLPPGNYQVIAAAQGIFNTGTSTMCFAINDGTDTKGTNCAEVAQATANGQPFTVVANFTYTSAGSKTFSLYGSASANTLSVPNSTAGKQQVSFQIYRFPSSTELALSPNTTPAYWSGYHGTDCGGWAVTSTSYTDFTADASCTLTQRAASNITATTSGSVKPAITLSLPKTGAYFICANNGAAPSSNSSSAVRMWDGTTVIAELNTYISAYDTKALCGIYIATSLTPTISLQGKATAGAINLGVETANSAIEWSVVSLSQNMPAPVLVGSVTSGSTGAERIERARVYVANASSAITSQSGTWLTAIANVGVGSATLTMTGFSSSPHCVCSHVEAFKICSVNVTSATSAAVATVNTFTNSAENGSADIHCMGPR